MVAVRGDPWQGGCARRLSPSLDSAGPKIGYLTFFAVKSVPGWSLPSRVRVNLISSPETFPFLGSSRLEEPLTRYPVAAVFHGHAHVGSPEGATSNGVPVYNVSLPLMRKHYPNQPPFRIFEIRAEGQVVWSRHERKRFPEIKELKQAVRDAVAPGKSLGHADR